LNGEPRELPRASDEFMRELLQIAEMTGCKRPNSYVDGPPLPTEQFEAWIEAMEANLERILPEYEIEERISRRHGGIEFVIRPCPLGEHDSGNNSGLITVAPSGVIGWHCFHSSHTMPWKEARKMIEDETEAVFTFPSGPRVLIGSQIEPESAEEVKVELPPDSVKRLEIDGADNLDFLAHELTDGTKLPFSFARETLKLMLLAALPKTRPTLPWFHTLHCRQYVILVSDKPGTGKGETWRRARATMEKAEGAFDLEFINGDSLGSPQWAYVAFGGERQSTKKTQPMAKPKDKPGIHVEISPIDPNGRIVFYDEGRKLFQHDSVGKSQDRGLLTMFTSLFESNQHATGSFSNGAAEVTDSNVSLMLHFTRDGFDKCFTGSGATRDGFLSRCCIVSDYGNEAPPDWKRVNVARVRELVEALKGCLTRSELTEEEAATKARHDYVRFLQKQDPLYASRLQFLFSQDLYARALFAAEARITAETCAQGN